MSLNEGKTRYKIDESEIDAPQRCAWAWQLGVQLPLHSALMLSDFPASS